MRLILAHVVLAIILLFNFVKCGICESTGFLRDIHYYRNLATCVMPVCPLVSRYGRRQQPQTYFAHLF